MLQNARVTAFTVFELLRENQLGDKITPLPPRLGLRVGYFYILSSESYFLKYEKNISQESFIPGNIRKCAR